MESEKHVDDNNMASFRVTPPTGRVNRTSAEPADLGLVVDLMMAGFLSGVRCLDNLMDAGHDPLLHQRFTEKLLCE